jgi:hypothetical protein
VAAPQPPTHVAAVDARSGGFRWDDAGIGAAAMLGLICASRAALVLDSPRAQATARCCGY